MFSTWVQNHSSKKFCTNSRTFPDFLGRLEDFLGRKRNFVRLNLKNVPWNRTNDVLFHIKRHVVSSQTSRRFLQTSSDYNKTREIPEKCSQNLYFQTLWESHNSQQLFLNSNLGVKWRDRKHKNIFMVMDESPDKRKLVYHARQSKECPQLVLSA